MSEIAQLKQDLLCSHCTAAKLMVWDSKRGDGLEDKPHGLSYHGPSGLHFLVRCDYFRVTVQSPAALIKCEGFQAKKGAEPAV